MGELAGILAKVDEKFQDRVGVCIDTCHAFAAGNDISTLAGWNTFLEEVDRVIGWEKVKAFHLNDSTFAVGAKKDRHALIGKGKDRELGRSLSFLCPAPSFLLLFSGFIGLEAFRILMNDPRTNHLPMLLETDGDEFAREIALLYSLCQ